MKRRLLIAVIFLFAGAVVNVAVAWGCAVAINIDADARRSFSAPPMGNGMIDTLQTAGAVRVRVQRSNERSPLVFDPIPPGLFSHPVVPDWAHKEVAAFGYPIPERLDVDGRGWPMIALWSTHSRSPRQYPGSLPTAEGHLGITLPPFALPPFESYRQNARVLPIRPAWIGFAINTLFYAAVLWLLIPGSFALRRFIRVKRGLCPACAYPRGESDVCSECGNALPDRAKVAT